MTKQLLSHIPIEREKLSGKLLISCYDSELRVWRRYVRNGDMSRTIRQMMNAWVATQCEKERRK